MVGTLAVVLCCGGRAAHAQTNNAPTSMDNTVTATEDTDYTFQVSDFPFSDIDSGDTLTSVKVTLPTKGWLRISSGLNTKQLDIKVRRIESGNLKYRPLANATGTGYASFTFKVNDGTVDSSDTYTMTINVTPVNDRPRSADKTVTMFEDTDYTFQTTDFAYSDVEDAPLANVKIVTLPANGALKLGANNVSPNDTVSPTQLGNGNLKYHPPANATGTGYASFTFKVNDGTVDSGEYTMTIDVTPVNNAPTTANKTVTTNRNTDYTFQASDFPFSDIDSGDTLASVKIITLPDAGELRLDGTPIIQGHLPQTVTRAQLDDGELRYRPPANATGTSYASFTFKVNDGTVDSRNTGTMTINVRAATPPVVINRGGGGGGGGADDHGNTAAQATSVPLNANRMATTAGQLNAPDDVDYFTVVVPQASVLVVETTGSTDTVGTVWQDGEELARADDGGARRNFRLSVRVQAGSVVIAVAGNGRQTGAYTLQTTLIVGYLENPGAESFQSGIGVISGWTCEADEVVIELNGERQFAAYGTERLDTEEACGDTDNGFGLLFNWNRLGAGEHEVVAYVDGIELGRATVRVTTVGEGEEEEFLREVAGACEVPAFPVDGETVTLVWQQPQQNFVIAHGPAPQGAGHAGAIEVGYLENPSPNTFQSGIGVISGWVCEGDAVEVALGHLGRQVAAYGTERLDTADVCGDTDNGFGLLFNWNRLGDGEHEVVAYVDDEELGRATVRVTTVGAGEEEEFLRGVEGECVAEDFPGMGQTVTLEWQQNQQNFVMTGVE